MLSIIQKQREHEAAFVSLRTLLSELAIIGKVSIKEAALCIYNEIERSVTRPEMYDYLLETRLYVPTNGEDDYLCSIACDDFIASNDWSELLDGSAYNRKEFANWYRLVARNDPLPPCLESESVKVRVTQGTIEGGGNRYGVGDTLAVSTAEAERLIGKGVAEQAGYEPAELQARMQWIEAERDQARQALTDAEARAAAAERERDELRERLAAIEAQAPQRPPNARAAAQEARHATNKAETLSAALCLLAQGQNDFRDGSGRVVAVRLAEAIADQAHRWWSNGNPPLSNKIMAEHIGNALSGSRVIDKDTRVIGADSPE